MSVSVKVAVFKMTNVRKGIYSNNGRIIAVIWVIDKNARARAAAPSTCRAAAARFACAGDACAIAAQSTVHKHIVNLHITYNKEIKPTSTYIVFFVILM